MNYILLGMIIEKATNSNVALELRNRFFDPLGLENTFMSIEEPLDGELANGHILGIDGARYPRGALDSMGWTAAGIFSTAEDLARWAQVLFEGKLTLLPSRTPIRKLKLLMLPNVSVIFLCRELNPIKNT
jgi:D-alanyl-D-alanine carboxypeptidase